MKKKVFPVIVVPIYKNLERLKPQEVNSITQALKLLKNYPFSFVGPKAINWHNYLDLSIENGADATSYVFHEEFFSSIEGYNRLLISTDFYKTFKKYSHLLIYQTDAYLFGSNLEEWCKADYDYIGAPWFDTWRKCDPNAKIVGIGNGGFSLRNISKALGILNRIKKLRSLKKFWDKYSMEKFLEYSKLVISFNRYFKIKKIWELPSALNEDIDNEDIFWGMYVNNAFADFRVAPVAEAIKFSFEVNPRELYELNGKQLPFGCHAWERFDPEFWSKFIHA